MAAFLLFLVSLIYFAYGATKPNILFIMADDLGWGNVGFHNSENSQIITPIMDSLVNDEGLELMRHYVSSDSSPTRSSFQSGRIPVHVNIDDPTSLNIFNPYYGMPSSMTTIATKLKDANYMTHLVGKWDCGFATYSQLPTRKGYDTFYGYLSNDIDYYSKTVVPRKGTYSEIIENCGEYTFSDLWENEEPVYTLDDTQYSEDLFVGRVLDIIDEHAVSVSQKGDDADPFFIMYSTHLPHAPLQLPEKYVTTFVANLESDDDESYCSTTNKYIFPLAIDSDNDDGIIGSADFQCRQLLQASVNLLDTIIGQIVGRLKSNNLWDNTLLIFTTDNGGSLELESTAGNNWPLRGAKYSDLEGGIRATTFISGGILPASRRGQKEYGLTHIADWYRTFCGMLDLDATDQLAIDEGLPDVDGYNLWELIKGEVSTSPRTELVVSSDVLIWNEYKLNIGIDNNKYAIWQGSVFPNSSTPTQSELEKITLDCANNGGCLFNVIEDPGEHNNLASSKLKKFQEMNERLLALKEEFYTNDMEGIDSCPDGWQNNDEGITNCACWMAKSNYGQFVGPYQNLEDYQKNWRKYMRSPGNQKINFHVYIIIVVCASALIIVCGSICYCYKHRIEVFTAADPPIPIPKDEETYSQIQRELLKKDQEERIGERMPLIGNHQPIAIGVDT